MSDLDLLKKLERKVGSAFPHQLEGERCVELELGADDHPYYGLIRRHTPSEKQEIVTLIGRLTGLRRLNLRRNKLGQLPDNFRNLRELEQLNLGSNYLGDVPEQIRGFSKLKYLHLGNDDITDLPAWFGDFAQLEYLTLHKNLKLKSVEVLAAQTSLRTLNIYFLNLGRLPKFIYELKNLVTLNLWNINDLSDDVGRLANLEFFSLCGTPGMRTLPDGFTRLKKLRMTRLFQNNLEQLPANIGDLENLEQISLYQNKLSALPDSMTRLKKLTKLNLGWNCFETLPVWIHQMTSLQWLAVFENPLRSDVTITLPPATHVARAWPFTTLHN